jgi:hypothetical protein
VYFKAVYRTEVYGPAFEGTKLEGRTTDVLLSIVEIDKVRGNGAQSVTTSAQICQFVTKLNASDMRTS